MAISGSGGAYYRSNVTVPSSAGLSVNYTRHVFVRSSVAAPIVAIRTAGGFVGTSNQEPHELFHFSHSQQTHRNASGVYAISNMTPANFPADTWISVAATLGGNFITSYVNGIVDGSTSGAVASDVRDVHVDALAALNSAGALDSSSQFVSGELAEYAVWDTALTVAEIGALSKGLRAPRVRPGALVFYAPLVRTFHDHVGGRFLNRLAGADAFSAHPRVFG